MKRTATTLMLLAGFGGGCVSPDSQTGKKQMGGYGTVTRPATIPGVQGPGGEPVAMTPTARGVAPGSVQQAGYSQPTGPASMIQQAGFSRKAAGDCSTCAHVPGGYGDGIGGKHGMGGGYGGPGSGPGMDGMSRAGILPVPGMGPPGAVAAVGALGPGMGVPPACTNMRTSIKFGVPPAWSMKVTWQLPGGGFNDEANGLSVPGPAYNFLQGNVYRLRLTSVLPNFAGRTFYPTLQVEPANPKTITFLSHASVPVNFTNEDFEQAAAGNLVVKVIYLPDPAYQDFAVVAAAEEIVSTRLEPGADPVAEAQRRGSVLAIIRMGNIDLENKASPPIMALPPGGPIMLPPGAVPPGAMPPRPGVNPPGMANVNTPPLAPVAPTLVGPTRPVNTVPMNPNVGNPPMPTAPVAPGPFPPGVNGNRPGALPNLGGR
jgi:hypothetical protein